MWKVTASYTGYNTYVEDKLSALTPRFDFVFQISNCNFLHIWKVANKTLAESLQGKLIKIMRGLPGLQINSSETNE